MPPPPNVFVPKNNFLTTELKRANKKTGVRLGERCVRVRKTGSNQSFPFTFMLPCIVIDFFLNNQPDALIIQILFCYKTLHVSDIFCAHHQEFSTVHSALVSYMQVLMTASKHSQDGTPLGSGHQKLHVTYQCQMYSRKLLMMDREDVRNM